MLAVAVGSWMRAANKRINRISRQLRMSTCSFSSPPSPSSPPVPVYLSIGSNLFNRVSHVHRSLASLRLRANGNDKDEPFVTIKDTSYLYETNPLYISDQPLYLNLCVLIETNLPYTALFRRIKDIEKAMGRPGQEDKAEDGTPLYQRNGPRIIDLDILFYGSSIINDPSIPLTVPHVALHTREFVLAPLADITTKTFTHPVTGLTVKQMIDQLPTSAAPSVFRVFPFARDGRVFRWRSRSLIMGILNITQNSFSDGGKHFSPQGELSVSSVLSHALRLHHDGADVLDLGAESTRPGAAPVADDEQIKALEPIIKTLKQMKPELVISVDTRSSVVADACLRAGADWINDVSGGRFDSAMADTIARWQATYICMHSRGTPENMNKPEHIQYSLPQSSTQSSSSSSSPSSSPSALVAAVRAELEERIQAAMDAGIYRWNLIADPGVGFAKIGSQNYDLIKGLSSLRPFGSIPLLLGPSRKRFLQQTLREAMKDTGAGEDKSEEEGGLGNADYDAATSAVVCYGVLNGVSIFRVHNVRQARAAAAVSEKIVETRQDKE